MAKPRNTPSRPRDLSQLARHIVAISTGEAEDQRPTEVDPKRTKRGKARADKLTPEERSKIAKQAAEARWVDKR